jgi:hypothetical protein
MKKTFLQEKKMKESLYEKNLRIHRNLWKFYSFFLFIGIIIVSFKGIH